MDRPSLPGLGTYASADGYAAQRPETRQRGSQHLGDRKRERLPERKGTSFLLVTGRLW